MTTETLPLASYDLSESQVRLRGLRSGLRHIKTAHQRCSDSLVPSAIKSEAEDYLNCLAHELRILEGYPPNALGPRQQKRLERLCSHAADLLSAHENDNVAVRSLREAFASLLPQIAGDFQRLHNHQPSSSF